MKEIELFIWWFVNEIISTSLKEDLEKLRALIESDPNQVELNIACNFEDLALKARMQGINAPENITPSMLVVELKNKL